MRFYKFIIICLLLFGASVSMLAQSDTTKLKFSTEEIDPNQWNKRIKFRSSSRISVMDDAKSVLRVGVGPADAGYGYFGLVPLVINLSYERKVFTPSFTARVDLVTRFSRPNEYNFDYVIQDWSTGRLSSEIRGRNRFWLNLSMRYYYNKKRRMNSGRSGNNPFGQYFTVKLFSALSFSGETKRRWSTTGTVGSLLLSKSERNFIGTRGVGFSFSWGIQQRIMKKFFVDFNVGAFVRQEYLGNVSIPFQPTLSLQIGYLIRQK